MVTKITIQKRNMTSILPPFAVVVITTELLNLYRSFLYWNQWRLLGECAKPSASPEKYIIELLTTQSIVFEIIFVSLSNNNCELILYLKL